MKGTKPIHVLYFGSCFSVIFLVILAQFIVIKDQKQAHIQGNPVVIQENDAVSRVELSVIEKGKKSLGMTGIFAEYYLVLSNGMVIYLTKENFDKYEANQSYAFELSERTTVSQWIGLFKDMK